eukprot:scaffold7154_cov122-Skeletonema_marinoi.AAC.1
MNFAKYALAAALCAASSTAFITPKNARVSRYNAGQQVPSRVMAATLDTPTTEADAGPSVMRPPIDFVWSDVASQLVEKFGYSQAEVDMYD